MITLEVHNRVVRIVGAPLSAIRAVDIATSYLVEGHYFAPSFRSKHWDGREKLLKKAAAGPWTYSGLALDVCKALKNGGHAFRAVDKTTKGPKRDLIWSADVELRPYQKRVVKKLLAKPFRGVGTAVMPIRSGKTKTAAGCVHKLGRSTLVIVPSKLLLYQTAKSFQECFPHETIGMIGDSEFNLEFITVATIQSLHSLKQLKGDDRWDQIANGFEVMVLDECHHARGGGDWHKVFTDLNARYRLGFSATLFEDSNTEQGRGIIWARAACGPVRARVTTTELVDNGYLMPQNIVMYHVDLPRRYQHAGWSQTMTTKCLHENQQRNDMIARLCEDFAKDGRRVIVCARQRNHVAALVDALDGLGVDHRAMTGSDSQGRREEIIDGLAARDFNVVIGTVLREGVDIPTVDVVINAEGGKDAKNVIQRQRNLTVSDGKTEAIFIDFMDRTNKTLHKHSRARLKMYRAEPSSTVEVKDW